MRTIEQEYISLRNLSIKYDLHPDTIRKKDLQEGIHYIRIGKTIRYHVKNMHEYLVNPTENIENILDKFLLDAV